MIDHELYQGLLHIGRIAYGDFVVARSVVEHNGGVGEDGESQCAFIADDEYPVVTGRLVGHKAPTATSWQARGEAETGTYGVLGGVESATIGRDAFGLQDGAKHHLQ